MIRLRKNLIYLAFSLFWAMSLVPVAEAETVIKFSTVYMPNNTAWQILEKRLAAVTTESGGTVKFDVGFDNKYAKVPETVEKIESGELQMAYVVFSSKPSRFPSLGVIELPLIRRTALAGTKALCEMQAAGMFDHDFTGLKVLATWALSPYPILLDDKVQVSSPSDLRGIRIRAPGPTGGRALQKLGAVPVNLAIGDAGKGLASGTVQGISYGLFASTATAGTDGKMLMDQVTQILDIGFSGPAVGVFMSEKYFNSLPPQVQKSLVKNLGADCAMATEIATDRDKQEILTRDALAKDGKHKFIKFDQAALDSMRQSMLEVYDAWTASISGQGIDGKALIEKASAIIRKNE